MKEVTMYEANDGTMHKTEYACRIHDARDDAQSVFESWYSSGDNTLWSHQGNGKIDVHDIMEWIADNAYHLVTLVQAEIDHKPLSY